MPISLLKIKNARNLVDYTLRPGSYFNILHGKNGSGKTTLLECIYFIIRARTFRSINIKNFINNNASECIIYSELKTPQTHLQIGIKKSKLINQKPVYHLNQKKLSSISYLSSLVFLSIITPDTFQLLDSSANNRRRFLDWGVFHVEHDNYIRLWKEFNKTLQQRNQLLKQTPVNLALIESWDSALVQKNLAIHKSRENYFTVLVPYIKQLLKLFSSELYKNLSFIYKKGWIDNSNENYAELLKQRLNDDMAAGFTRYGTHRCDIQIMFKGQLAKNILSRGQKKIVILCMVLGQLIHNYEYSHQLKFPAKEYLLLIDDLDSELDNDNLIQTLKLLSTLSDIQFFISTTDSSKYATVDDTKKSVFHVEQS